ncbi:MAG: polysaccharide deacetylase family protein [Erysipelotrichaceae bacterium]|nr:polysaccharide deacetylase family protein [Erysipelotrichaceae bacterium]
MKKSNNTILYIATVLIFTITSLIILFNIKEDYFQDALENGFLFNKINILDYQMGKGKYDSINIEDGFKVYKENNIVKIDKNEETLSIDSTLLNDEEKTRVIKNVIYSIKDDKDTYNDLGNNQEFLDEIHNFDEFFDSFDFDYESIIIKHTKDQNIIYKLPYNESSKFMSFMFENIESDPILIKLEERYIDPNKPIIALTFDDGPNIYTKDIVNTLKQFNSVATFFVVGKNVEGKEDIINNILEEGNEIGGHSWDHTLMLKLDYEELYKQLYWVKDVIKASSKEEYEIKLFRPPYGAIDDNVRINSSYPLILWNIDTYDWKSHDIDSIIEEAILTVKDGDIILLHDIHEETRDAVEQLVPILIDKGFQLVTVSQLYDLKGIELKAGEVYYNIK